MVCPTAINACPVHKYFSALLSHCPGTLSKKLMLALITYRVEDYSHIQKTVLETTVEFSLLVVFINLGCMYWAFENWCWFAPVSFQRCSTMNRHFEDKLKTTALRDVLISNTCVVDTGIILQFCIWSIWPFAKIVIVIIKVKAQFFPLLNVYYCQTVPHQPMGAATSKEIPVSGRKRYQCVLPGCWQKPFDPICTTLNYQQRGATQSLGRIFLEQSLSRWLLKKSKFLCSVVLKLHHWKESQKWFA